MKILLHHRAGIHCVAAFLATAAFAAPRTASVDANRLFNEHPKTAGLSAKLKEVAQQYNQENDAMRARYREAVAASDRAKAEYKAPNLTAAAREQKRQQLDSALAHIAELDREIAAFRASRRKILYDETQRMRDIVIREMRDAVARKAAELGYGLVLDDSGNFLPYFWSAGHGFGKFTTPARPQVSSAPDITIEVLDLLQAASKKEPPATKLEDESSK